MNANMKSPHINKIRDILSEQNGLLRTSNLAKFHIPRTYLSIMQQNGEILRLSRGIYVAANHLIDEMSMTQSRFKSAIFSHETALFLLDLTDRSPLFFTVTVPAGYNASSLKSDGLKVFYIKRDLHRLGLTSLQSPFGNEVQSYNLERTICDVLRCRTLIDIQLVSQALKNYVIHKNRNLNLLYQYAQLFRVQKIVRETIEVLL